MTIRRSIVVPCYNESPNIPGLVERFASLWSSGDDWELILVDNGSTDDSATVLRSAAETHSFLRVVTVPAPNVGYGHGILAGLRAARGDYLAWTHADGQTPPADVLRAFDLLSTATDPPRTFVKGRRRERPLKDAAFTFGMEIAAWLFLGIRLPDINAQPKAFGRSLLDLATAPPTDLSLDLYFFWLARTRGFAVRTFDVFFGERAHGESKWAFNWRSKMRNIARTLGYMIRLRRSGSPGPRKEPV